MKIDNDSKAMTISPCDRIADIEVTTSMCFADGSFRGFAVYKPSTSVSKNR